MVTSKEVFAKRKQGFLAEAYNMALELIKQPHDEWNIKAYAWCLIDLIKQENNLNNTLEVQRFSAALKDLEISDKDEVLSKSVKYVLSLSDPNMKLVNEARTLSKQGLHQDAANIYRTALTNSPYNIDIHTSLGWELYNLGKPIFAEENITIYPAKKLLAEYIKLKNERPSRLHSLFLRFADKLVGLADFNLVAFLKLWDLSNLTEEDFDRYDAENGKTYPALAEKIVQHAAKDCFSKTNISDASYILPFLDDAINKLIDFIIFFSVSTSNELVASSNTRTSGL